MAYCKSQVTAPAGRDGETNAPSLPLAVSGKTDKTWPSQLEASLTSPCHALAPLLPSDPQLIILNKIEFAPLDCCKIIKHGTGLPNPCAAFGTVRLRFSFVGFGNNFVLRPCQVCRGFVSPPPSRLAALLLAAAYIIQLNSLPANFVHAPQWQIVIVSQLCGNCNLHSRIMALLGAPSRVWQLASDTRYCGYWFHEEMFTVLALFNNLGNILAWTAHSICV